MKIEKKPKKNYEICVCCKRLTDIPYEERIEKRDFYIEGAGQLCCECYKKLYK